MALSQEQGTQIVSSLSYRLKSTVAFEYFMDDDQFGGEDVRSIAEFLHYRYFPRPGMGRMNWYSWYLEEGLNGSVDLPEYTYDKKGHFEIYYGEVYCRVPGCNKKRIWSPAQGRNDMTVELAANYRSMR
ncbi:hypothetical protein BO86DRAFT_374498 [Aspergillus japonicus CBS 114.51]|uniref:Uncharacterized protein n=2 Tax=Aspergillus TaxID=5052 RepID=A0A2V5GS33_ASPV1|nr:hypothetical protein BO86DRAFT_374498 [Aspergillus japonicus CBS 114.51]PYI13848.1 hypothetical protein BO99DRAFT_477429 [Aspergillus violaceofuscus CBS 115571]RAH87482.1 hypothetical protein BO86DRAFT_374498 [Aspergillus japonicus CBS 114.51]